MKLSNSTPFVFFFLLFGMVGVGSARPVTYSFSDSNAQKQILFESKAPVEYIEGEAKGVVGIAALDDAQPDLDLKATVSVPVEKMQTDNTTRDGHMRSNEWLDADHYPVIRFDLNPPSKKSVVKKGPNSWFVNATGIFSLKGVTQTISVPVTLRREKVASEDKLHVEGRFVVHLEDYRIYGPIGIQMIGLKVSPDVPVTFHLVGVSDQGWEKLSPRRKPGSRY